MAAKKTASENTLDFLEQEARKIGYTKMLSDLDSMLSSKEITDTQRSLLMVQRNDIEKRLS